QCSGDEECAAFMNAQQTFETEVAAIHHVKGAGLESDLVECEHIVRTAVGNVDEGGNAAAQVEERMHLHGAARALKGSPGTKRKADVNGRRIQGVDCIVEFDAKRFIGIERARDCDQHL